MNGSMLTAGVKMTVLLLKHHPIELGSSLQFHCIVNQSNK